VPAIICGVVLPSLVSSRETSEDLYKKRATKLLLFVSGLSILFALFEFTFAKMLILITFGKDYLFAANVLQIYTWAGIFIAMIMALNQKLTVENRTKIIIISSFFGAAANIGFNLMLIPHFGIIGSAWATLISYAFVPLIIFTFHKFTKIN
jgi:O-antigen/teichoic acid export membrane protein